MMIFAQFTLIMLRVYDNNGWDDFIDQPEETAQLITDYALKYDNQDWQNLKYWMGGHEPTSIDAYTPIKTVDDILQANDFPPLMNTIWALWNQDLNGESQLARYYNTVQPNKLLLEHHPIISGYDPPKAFGYELIRKIFLIVKSASGHISIYFFECSLPNLLINFASSSISTFFAASETANHFLFRRFFSG